MSGSQTSEKAPLRLLLVEDNPGDARLIQEMLREAGREAFRIDLVSTLASARAAVQETDYHIILLDLSLPDSFGLETLFHLLEETEEAPIIVLTGFDDEQLGIRAVQEGAQDYLLKGDVDGKLLLRAISYAIERYDIESNLRQSEREYRSLIDDVFDTSMVAVLILDREFRVVWCNSTTEIYFGISRERLIGKDKRKLIDSDLKCIFADPDDYSTRLFEAYETGDFTRRFECQVLLEGEREERWLEHWSQPIREGIYRSGRIEQYMDITDRKTLEFAEGEQREFAEALSDISTVLTSSLDLNDVLPKILSSLDLVITNDTATIMLVEERDSSKVRQHLGYDKRQANQAANKEQVGLLFQHYAPAIFETRQPIIVDDLREDSPLQEIAEAVKLCAYIGAPILFQNKILGLINLTNENPGYYGEKHIERLTAFAELAAIAIQNTYLFDQSQELGQLRERQRLARDLHDSVSQTLFSCHAMAESAVRRWDKDPERARELVEEVNQLTMTALAEMRVLLLELRPHHLTQMGLKQLFEQYLRPIQSRRGFDLSLNMDEKIDLPPDVQIAMYRVTQEALNNIFKHAVATKVEVNVENDPEFIRLQIKDNGTGFKFDEIMPTSLGLNIMRERAEEIGAALDITTELDQGTGVNLVWPKG